jgi:hypothetical protein
MVAENAGFIKQNQAKTCNELSKSGHYRYSSMKIVLEG